MEEFATQFPEVMLSIMVLLLAIIGWLIRGSILKLNGTMEKIVVNIDSMDTRLTTQETTCRLCRKMCQSALAG